MKDGRRFAVILALAAAGGVAAQQRAAEVQVKVCSEPQQAISALRLAAAKPSHMRVWLFDTPAFSLQQRGLLVRLRDDGRRVELTVKARVENCARVDARTLGARGKCETDLHGNHVQDAVSVSGRPRKAQARELIDADATAAAALLPAALTAEQRALIESQGGLQATGLKRYGPAPVVLYDWPGTEAEVEVWTLPNTPPLMEVSQKSTATAAPALRQRLEQQLAAAGLTLCADQASRTPARLKALAG